MQFNTPGTLHCGKVSLNRDRLPTSTRRSWRSRFKHWPTLAFMAYLRHAVWGWIYLFYLLYTHSFVGFCIYVKFQLIDSYNSVCTISNCFWCRRHIQWFCLLYLFPSIFPSYYVIRAYCVMCAILRVGDVDVYNVGSPLFVCACFVCDLHARHAWMITGSSIRAVICRRVACI